MVTDRNRDTLIVGLAIVLCAVFLSIKYFPGVESSHYYAGFILSAIDPTLLAKDPIVGADIGATSPYKLTAYYLLPKLFGRLWLDDRFIAVFYVLTVAAAFFFADRIAVRLGASNLLVRLSVLLLFLRDHALFENQVNFAHQPDFHHSALATPLILAVLWLAVSGRGLIPVIIGTGVLAAVSLQVATFTGGFALLAAAAIGTPRDRRIVAAMIGIGLIAVAWVLFVHYRVPEADRLYLWHNLVYDWFEGMVEPFNPSFRNMQMVATGNVLFAAIMAFALCWPAGEDRAPVRALRVICATAVLIWLVLGLFVQFAPDALKYPQVLLFPVTRQLQGPQIVAMIGVTVFVLNWAAREPGAVRAVVAAAVMLCLVAAGPGNWSLWIGLFAASCIAAVLLPPVLERVAPGWPGPEPFHVEPRTPIFLALLATMGLAMGIAAVQKAPDWLFLARTGIHGGSGNAQWVGVPEFLERETPRDAVVLPMQFSEEEIDGRRGLVVRRHVASRSGRAVPFPMKLSKGLNRDWFEFVERQRTLLDGIGEAWMAGDGQRVSEDIRKLEPRPGYVIVPDKVADAPGDALPRRRLGSVNGFTIFALPDTP